MSRNSNDLWSILSNLINEPRIFIRPWIKVVQWFQNFRDPIEARILPNHRIP